MSVRSKFVKHARPGTPSPEGGDVHRNSAGGLSPPLVTMLGSMLSDVSVALGYKALPELLLCN